MMNYSPGTETPADAAVVMDGLRVKRGRALVLDGLSISVPRGQVVGLLGPSGCGKTTLMRSIVGVQRVAGGTVTVLGQPAGTAALRHRVGYVTQAASVYDDLTVTQNLQYFRRVLGAGADDVASAIAATDLGANAAQLVSTLSGGQRSRSPSPPPCSAPPTSSSWTSRPSASTRCSAPTSGTCSTASRRAAPAS